MAVAAPGCRAAVLVTLGGCGRWRDGDAGGSTRAGDADEFGVAGTYSGGVGVDLGHGHHPFHVPALAGQDERDDGSGLPGSGGTATTVQVVLVVGGRVDVD